VRSLGIAAVLALAACGAQDWSFDSEAGLNSLADAEAESAAEGSLDDGDGGDDAELEDEASDDDVVHIRDASVDRPPTPCIDASDCPFLLPVCVAATGFCAACQTNADCAGAAAGPACDTSSGACVPCTADVDCVSPGLRRCDKSSNSCVACLSTLDCPHESFCGLPTHTCIPEHL
jgi:hypothetical protein